MFRTSCETELGGIFTSIKGEREGIYREICYPEFAHKSAGERALWFEDCEFHGDTFHDFCASFACLRVRRRGKGRDADNFARETRGFKENLAGHSPKWKRQTKKFAKHLTEILKFHGFPHHDQDFCRERLRRIALKLTSTGNWSNSVTCLYKSIYIFFILFVATSFQFHLLILFHQV